MSANQQRNSRFRRDSGVYKCATCGRMTRQTGVQSIGSESCPQCYELAGLDNLLNDCPEEGVAANYREAERLLAEIVAKGGNAERVRAQHEYAFPVGDAEGRS